MTTLDTSTLTLFGSDASQTSSLLGALYAGTGVGTGAQAGLAALTAAEKNETREVAATAKRSDVQRDIAAFRQGVAAARDPATALKNPAVLKVLLTANGLADQLGYTALATRALLSDTKNPKSLANTLTDTRWKAVATTYGFAAKGLSVLKNAAVLNTIANGYAEIAWRRSLDATTPGLSNALTFRAQAAGIKTVDQILGDSTLRTVVTTALNIPQEIAYQNLPAQEKAISTRLDVTRFAKDPKFVEAFTQRYLLAAGNAATGTTGFTSIAASTASLLV